MQLIELMNSPQQETEELLAAHRTNQFLKKKLAMRRRDFEAAKQRIFAENHELMRLLAEMDPDNVAPDLPPYREFVGSDSIL